MYLFLIRLASVVVVFNLKYSKMLWNPPKYPFRLLLTSYFFLSFTSGSINFALYLCNISWFDLVSLGYTAKFEYSHTNGRIKYFYIMRDRSDRDQIRVDEQALVKKKISILIDSVCWRRNNRRKKWHNLWMC